LQGTPSAGDAALQKNCFRRFQLLGDVGKISKVLRKVAEKERNEIER
jgi:hypothetical protein